MELTTMTGSQKMSSLVTGKGMNKLRAVLAEFYPEVGGLVV